MDRYEILILTIPEITKDEASTMEFQIEKIINKAKGAIISFDRWGKYKLAYPVKNNDYGVYFLVRFELQERSSLINDLNMLFAVKFNDLVMRSAVTALDKNQSLEYEKPPSLEDSPKRQVSSFLEQRGLGASKNDNDDEESDLVEKVSDLEESVSNLKLSSSTESEKNDLSSDAKKNVVMSASSDVENSEEDTKKEV